MALGTMATIMPSPGEILTLEEYGGQDLLWDRKLEFVVASHLEDLGETVNWWNRHGETNRFPDMEIRDGIQVDCKGSKKWYGSGFIGVESYGNMKVRRSYGQIWYVLNDLSVVSWDEFEEVKCRKNNGWAFQLPEPRSISQWLTLL